MNSKQKKRNAFLVVIGAFIAIAMVAGIGLSTGTADSDQVRVTTITSKVSADLRAVLGKSSVGTVGVLITTATHDYESIIAAVEAIGGTVNHKFKYATGLAAELPRDAIEIVGKLPGVERVSRDVIRTLAAGDETSLPGATSLGSTTVEDVNDLDQAIRGGHAFHVTSDKYGSVVGLDSAQVAVLAAQIGPDTYANPNTLNATPVWATGNLGQDSLVVVIDTGIYEDHFMVAGSVVGCEDMSTDVGDADFEGGCLASNHWHGSHVASTVAGHGAILVHASDPLARAIGRYAAPPAQASSIGFPGAKIVPLLGIAPEAELYAIKVFPHTGAGAPNSTIIAAIERAIDLKLIDGFDVDVINMSLGGGALFEGYDLESMAVDAATDAGIAVVDSAGNEGPSSLTVGTPGAANSSITVGAVAVPVNMRVFWDLNFGKPGIGHQLFVSDDPQMAYFSSRGPTGDGRIKPTVSANGVFVLAAFPSTADPQGIAFSSGTSMSSPGTAGVVALLNTAGESLGASPFDYKQALLAGADQLPGFTPNDQGVGFVNAAVSHAALMADAALGESHPAISPVFSNDRAMPKGIDLGIVGSGGTVINVSGLEPGHSQHYYFETTDDTSKITVDVTGFGTRRDPYGLNSAELYLHGGPPSEFSYYFNSLNVFGDATMTVEDLSTSVAGSVSGLALEDLLIQTGPNTFVVENDWTSSGPISLDVAITVEDTPRPPADFAGTLANHTAIGFFPIGSGPMALELDWERDWTKFPASDMDLIVAWFDTTVGDLHFEVGAATLNAPEGVVLDGPDVGAVFIQISAFETNGLNEDWEVFVTPLP